MRFVIVLRKMLLSLNKQKIYKKKPKNIKLQKKLKSRKSFDEKILFFTKKDPKKETKILN